ncbi:histidine kinase dimerization/phospho-acceptor domain-containing protein, partial [Enterobacter hormaechei]|uniref:histidine kinase dimerization/phospho-acceptor domain-containing protein n=1 Tax=Enterobacter hormaechei TaxID=158836 RepID=UPI0023E87DEC
RELQIEREASFHQRQFMGMVAHEFRTPLAVIQAALENLRLSAASTSQEARFDRIGRAATRLVRELQIEREASFHQRQFMGMVAHEFRTPLAVIQA